MHQRLHAAGPQHSACLGAPAPAAQLRGRASARRAAAQGWRLAFFVVACFSGAVCLLALVCIIEPRALAADGPHTARPKDEEKPLALSPRAAAAPGGTAAAAAAANGADGVKAAGAWGPRADKAAHGVPNGHALSGKENREHGRNGAAAVKNGEAGLEGHVGGAAVKPPARAPDGTPLCNGARPGAPPGGGHPAPEGGAGKGAAWGERGAAAGAAKAAPRHSCGAAVSAFALEIGRALGNMVRVMWSMLFVPTFAIIMVEHVIGNLQTITPYKIVYFQARGRPHPYPPAASMFPPLLATRAPLLLGARRAAGAARS